MNMPMRTPRANIVVLRFLLSVEAAALGKTHVGTIQLNGLAMANCPPDIPAYLSQVTGVRLGDATVPEGVTVSIDGGAKQSGDNPRETILDALRLCIQVADDADTFDDVPLTVMAEFAFTESATPVSPTGILSVISPSVSPPFVVTTDGGVSVNASWVEISRSGTVIEGPTNYVGSWDVATNTPTLIDGTGTVGDLLIVSVAGTRNLGSGSIVWGVGDAAVYNGTIWERIEVAAGDYAVKSEANTFLDQQTIVSSIEEAGAFHSRIRTRTSRGTVASPTAVDSGDVIGAWTAAGYDGSAFPTTGNAAVVGTATEDHTPTDHGTNISLGFTPNGETTRTDGLVVDEAGVWVHNQIRLPQLASAPATPATGETIIYARTDNKVYSKDDTGAVVELGATGGGGGGGTSIYFNVKDSPYNATGDGSTDDTTAIQAAIDAAEVAGGTVYFPPGSYKVTGLTIAANGVQLLGDGNASQIRMSSATGNTLAVDSSSQRHSIAVRNLRFYPSVTRTSGAEIAAEHFAILTLSDLQFSTCFHCVNLGNTSNMSVIAFIKNIRADTFTRFLYMVRCLDIWVSACSTDAAKVGAGSVIVEGGCESCSFSLCDFVNSANDNTTGTGNCLHLKAVDYAVSPPQYCSFSQCYFDSHQHGLYGSAGRDITFDNCWFSARPGVGAVVNDVSCESYVFNACRFENCGIHGLLINFGTDHAAHNCQAISNNFGATDGKGIEVGATVDGFTLTGNRCYNRSGFGGVQEYGIFLNSGCDNCIVQHNDLRGNDSGGLNDIDGPGTSRLVAVNLGA
jgi:hypothetical protein